MLDIKVDWKGVEPDCPDIYELSDDLTPIVYINDKKAEKLDYCGDVVVDEERKVVVKIGRQAVDEIALLSDIEPEDMAHFAPVLAHGEGWIAKAYLECDCVSREDVHLYQGVLDNLRDKYLISDFGSVPDQLDNWFVVDGSVVIIDWGFNSHRPNYPDY